MLQRQIFRDKINNFRGVEMKDEREQMQEKTIFLSYLDDNDDKVATYVTLLKKNDNVIVFRTHGNVITLPMSRVLKIKESLNGDNNGQD